MHGAQLQQGIHARPGLDLRSIRPITAALSSDRATLTLMPGLDFHVVEDFLVAPPSFAAHLPEGAGEGGALGDECDGQGHVGHKGTLVVTVGESQQALEDRESASGDQDAERRQRDQKYRS